MQKHLLPLLLALLLCSSALAAPLPLGEDLTGDECYPLGTTTEDAQFVYHYAYPQIDGDDETAQLINGVYAMVRGEAVDFTAPILYETLTLPDRSRVDVSYQITINSDDYFSVLVSTRNQIDGYDITVYSAQVFSRAGGKAGQVTSLPYLLGILTPGETDTWMQDRQTAKADACVRAMVLEQAELNGLDAWVDEEVLEFFFYPEEDFYMDDTGALVFFLQPDDDHDLLTFRFTMDEILDEL